MSPCGSSHQLLQVLTLTKGLPQSTKMLLRPPGAFMSRSYSYLFLLYRYDGLRYGSYAFAMIVGTISDPKAVAATGHDFFESSKIKKYLTDQVAPLEVYCRILKMKIVQITLTLRAPPHLSERFWPVQRASTTRLLMLRKVFECGGLLVNPLHPRRFTWNIIISWRFGSDRIFLSSIMGDG